MSTETAPEAPKKKSAKPGTQDGTGVKVKKEKKPKVPRVEYAIPEGGLETWPMDFDPKKHKPLRAKDFAKEHVFLRQKAEHYKKLAERLFKDADESEKLGGLKANSKAKKLLKLKRQLEELTASLKEDNVDIDAILASMSQDK